MRAIAFKSATLKFLDSVDVKHHRQIIRKAFDLMQDPRPHDSILLQDDIYRTDIGEYRIAYKFDDSIVRILAIGKRNDDAVYKQLKRMQ